MESKKIPYSKERNQEIFYGILKVLEDSYKKLDQIFETRDYHIDCLRVITCVYWLILFETNNPSWALDVASHGTKLFIEYLETYQTVKKQDKSNIISISDVKHYVYRKTVGNLLPNKSSYYIELESIIWSFITWIEMMINKDLKYEEFSKYVKDSACLIYKIITIGGSHYVITNWMLYTGKNKTIQESLEEDKKSLKQIYLNLKE